MPSWYDRLDRLGNKPSPVDAAHRYDDLNKAAPIVNAAQQHLHASYGLDPILVGSLPLGLGVPGDVDVDLHAAVKDKDEYQSLIARLNADAHLHASPYNTPDMDHNVYQADAGVFGDYPVDIGVTQGAQGLAFREAIKQRQATADSLSPELAQALIKKKQRLRGTHFDIGHARYKKFKRELNGALEGAPESTEIKRHKMARVLNMEDEADVARLDKMLSAKNVYGHRTSHGEDVLESGQLMSGLHALSKGKLKSYESGFVPGARAPMEIPELSKEQLDSLQQAWLQEKPDYAAVDAVGHPRDALKGALIQHRLRNVNQHLEGLGEAGEDWRRKNLRISKLSPHIFLTQGGLVGDKGYGDTGFLFRSNKAETSPFVTLIKNEAILSPNKALHMRGVNMHNALVVAPDDKIQDMNERHPDYNYVPESALKERDKLLPTYDVGGTVRRLAPHLRDGTMQILQG